MQTIVLPEGLAGRTIFDLTGQQAARRAYAPALGATSACNGMQRLRYPPLRRHAAKPADGTISRCFSKMLKSELRKQAISA